MGDDILEVVPLAEAESWGVGSKKGGGGMDVLRCGGRRTVACDTTQVNLEASGWKQEAVGAWSDKQKSLDLYYWYFGLDNSLLWDV